MKAQDLIANDKLLQEYRAWRDLPMTQIVVDIIRLENRIYMPHPDSIKAEITIAIVGESSGCNKALDRIFNLDTKEQELPELTPSYGSEKLMKEQYPFVKT